MINVFLLWNLIFLLLLYMNIYGSGFDLNTTWMRESILDDGMDASMNKYGQIIIRWNYTSDNITILMAGKTKGWFGIGFYSNRTNLNGGDFVVGWVDKDKAYLQDRHIERSKLVLDKDQNCDILKGSENSTYTTLMFQRKLKTCDKQDIDISFGTILIVWALGGADPKNVTDVLQLEDANIGNKTVQMLNKVYPKPNVSGLQTFELKTKNVTITGNNGTTYWCTHTKLPKTNEKHYMIGWEPIFQAENKLYVHHFLVYICSSPKIKDMFNEIDPSGYNCLNPNMSKYASLCINTLAVWAVGGKEHYLPSDIGFPFGSDKEESYFRLEVHYNYPESINFKDNSGIRIVHTKNFKPKYEGAIFDIGMFVSPFHVIPPGLPEIHTIGVCEAKCLQQKFPKEGVTVFSVLFHTHLAGIQVVFRRFRNGVEMEPIADYHFNFDLQVSEVVNLQWKDSSNKEYCFVFGGAVFLDDPIRLTGDDILVAECVYDTIDRTNTTVGNYPTQAEMCLIFLEYYPAINLSSCRSMLLPQTVYNLVGIQEVAPLPNSSNCTGSQCPVPLSMPGAPQKLTVLKPDECSNKTVTNCVMNYKSWTKDKMKTLNNLYYGKQQSLCRSNVGTFLSTEKDQVIYPNDAKLYKQPDICEKQ